VVAVPEGRSREECIEIKKEREQELRLMMKRLEAKYAALQVVPVISKLGTQRVKCVILVFGSVTQHLLCYDNINNHTNNSFRITGQLSLASLRGR